MSLPNHSLRSRVLNFIKRFGRKEGGVVSIEAVMILPLLFWGMWTSYSYFDGYRQSARNFKATYAIADVISRESRSVNEQYMTTLYDLLQLMIAERSDVSMRITFLRFDRPDDRHYVLWSCVRGESYDQWIDGTIGTIRDKLPLMADNSNMILVESNDLYERPFKIGFGDNQFAMENFIFTHPRVYHNINHADDDANCWVRP